MISPQISFHRTDVLSECIWPICHFSEMSPKPIVLTTKWHWTKLSVIIICPKRHFNQLPFVRIDIFTKRHFCELLFSRKVIFSKNHISESSLIRIAIFLRICVITICYIDNLCECYFAIKIVRSIDSSLKWQFGQMSFWEYSCASKLATK